MKNKKKKSLKALKVLKKSALVVAILFSIKGLIVLGAIIYAAYKITHP